MRLDDDFDNYNDDDIDYYKTNNSQLTLYAFVTALVVIIGVVLCVLLANRNVTSGVSSSTNRILQEAENNHHEQMQSEKSVNELLTGSTLTADDLDFWDDYPDESKYKEAEAVSLEDFDENEEDNDEEDPSTDGKHTCITYENGKEEWVEINPYLELNNYNFNDLVYQAPIMKYYENNHKASYVGIDISKTDDYVDFLRLKNAGIDYVMIRVGQRGYFSGELTLDDNFEDNLRRATEAGIGVGLYFYSQAITTDEAIEEAEFVLSAISVNSVSDNGVYDNTIETKIKYPIVFYMENINDDARTDSLTQMGRTNIAMAFMDTIKNAGYTPMLYGNKEWLIKKYSLGTLDGYELWVDEPGEMPSFPYKFQMWNYSKNGRVNGITSDASLSISFVDYSIR